MIDVRDKLPEPGVDVLILTHGKHKEYYVGRMEISGTWVAEMGWNTEPRPNQFNKNTSAGEMFVLHNVVSWEPLGDC